MMHSSANTTKIDLPSVAKSAQQYSLLELTNVTRLYGTVIGVNDITLSLPVGAYGLLGPNGAGKSTLLNLITGQLRPTIGKVQLLGSSPRNNPPLLSRLGYLPGSEGMYANVSAIDWVSYLVELQGYSRREARELARIALERVGMSQYVDREIAGYSRGMRQRTRLAQAIAHNPELLILDEPFSGLDPIGRHEMAEFLRQWIDQGHSLIMASHVLHEIESITRDFLLISGGRLLASGSADTIHELLADAPREVTIGSSAARILSSDLLLADLVDSVRLRTESQLTVSSRSVLKLYEFLCKWATEGKGEIYEIRSADESLQEVFSSLLRIHRGEM
jgi:ABC-2 type transport system ATP-binding protein